MSGTAEEVLAAARALSGALRKLRFGEPVTHVYLPLDYAWEPFSLYVRKFADRPKRVVFLGMNPGPFGMTQTGVPFGEIAAVRDWMGVEAEVKKPAREHPKRPIEGFACRRSEVSGRRLWGWAASRFGPAEAFFKEAFVVNYCPLVFLEESGRNRTPDKVSATEMAPVTAACDAHLRRVLEILQPEWLLGIGGFAEKKLAAAVETLDWENRVRQGGILHPSPASPAANRGWEEAVDRQLAKLGVSFQFSAPEPRRAGMRNGE